MKEKPIPISVKNLPKAYTAPYRPIGTASATFAVQPKPNPTNPSICGGAVPKNIDFVKAKRCVSKHHRKWCRIPGYLGCWIGVHKLRVAVINIRLKDSTVDFPLRSGDQLDTVYIRRVYVKTGTSPIQKIRHKG